ncbi:tail length tape measure protein [Pelagivirga sediminicola]|uniref:Tail length tape measure protein n=1 Tax=Pelagivirga sediminicola TaxID=2170575 RepID=A0A2T7G9P8_9RHOB|nr:lytic transglycosylase domain-containing protein [Pelagivirga sediminicola]PVA11141.1 tail length tape measure protein [Pelagivirga sediminicola]
MLRPLFAALLLFSGALPAFSQGPERILPPRPLASALDAGAAGRWARAAALAERDGPVAGALVEWARLRSGRGTAEEVLAFLAAYPHWPGLDRLRMQSLEALEDASDAEILAFYKGAAPETGAGVLRHAEALKNANRLGEAEIGIVEAWLTFDLSTEEHTAFLNAWGRLLEPHHDARMDMTLWRGLRDSALMLPLVSDDMRARADIRLMARDGRRGIEEKVAGLPEEMQRDAGIAHMLFELYISQDKAEKAMDLMQRQSRIEGGLGEAWRWAGWRRSFARRMMRKGDYARAYDLAAHHQLVDGSAYADLEWLSGYLALRFMNDPALALDHFQRLRAAVGSPISMGRAGYWIGRAQEALGDPEAAQIAYAQGAEEQTSFYGLLAAEKAGLPADPGLAGTEEFAPWRQAEFAQGDLFRAAMLLAASGQLTYAEWFITTLADTLERPDLGSLGAALGDLGQPHLQVMLGKAAAQRGIVLPAAYYALHPMRALDLPVPMEMALAIARRESEFDHLVASGAGALGLMQVLPGTASDVARDLGIAYDRSAVLTDWRYNAQLGATYLAQMSQRFGGNVVMISAAYNAGPARPPRWISEQGDPRSGVGMGALDVIDWIEFIPFDETRNYVQRVAESLPVYRARLGKAPHPVPFSEELTGATIPASLN